MDIESKISRTKLDYTTSSCGAEPVLTKFSLGDIHDAIKAQTDPREIVSSGQFLNLVLYNTSNEQQRLLKKQIILEVLSELLNYKIQLPIAAQDALGSLYDSPEDLALLAVINLVTVDLQLPKSLQQTAVEFIETKENETTSSKFQLLSVSLAMGRAIASIPRELTNLLIYSCGVLVKKQPDLHQAALLCARSYLNHSRVVTGSVSSDLPTGRSLVERFCQKIVKHQPVPMSRECVFLLSAASSPLYADIVRELISNPENVVDVLQSTFVKYPTEMFEIFGKIYSLSPAESIPLCLISSIVDNVLASRGNDVLDKVVKFALTCSESSAIIKAIFGDVDEEIESEKPSKCAPIVEEYQNRKLSGDCRVVWMAVVLRFLNHPVIEEALNDGSLQPFIEEALKTQGKTPAMLLLCPEMRFLRFSVDHCPLTCEPGSTVCGNCEILQSKMDANEAAKDSMARTCAILQTRLKNQDTEIRNMRKKVDEGMLAVNQRRAEVTAIQSQVSVKEKAIEELKVAAEQYETQLAEQRNKNQETMTVLKQTRREAEKTKSDFDKKRSECQQLQRELSATKEQLAVAKKKIEELELFKEKIGSLMGAFQK